MDSGIFRSAHTPRKTSKLIFTSLMRSALFACLVGLTITVLGPGGQVFAASQTTITSFHGKIAANTSEAKCPPGRYCRAPSTGNDVVVNLSMPKYKNVDLVCINVNFRQKNGKNENPMNRGEMVEIENLGGHKNIYRLPEYNMELCSNSAFAAGFENTHKVTFHVFAAHGSVNVASVNVSITGTK